MRLMVITLCLLLLALVPAQAHPGGRDSHGGHRDSTGGYHFHEGPLAGQAFRSKEAALEALDALISTPQSSSPAPPVTLTIPPATPSEDTITLASWNVRNLSTGSRSDAELGIISLILFRYDFIALQEVRDAEVVRRILPRMEEKMEAQRQERQERREQGKTQPHDEGYCIIHDVQMRPSKEGDGWYHKAGEKPDGKAIWCRGKYVVTHGVGLRLCPFTLISIGRGGKNASNPVSQVRTFPFAECLSVTPMLPRAGVNKSIDSASP